MFYKISFYGENTDFARVEMTQNESEIFSNVLNKANNSLQDGNSYVGGCSIDLSSPSETEYPQIIHVCKSCNNKWELGYDDNSGRCSYRDGKNNCVSCDVKCEEYVCSECGSMDWDFHTEKTLMLV